jgi:hypothetical protein
VVVANRVVEQVAHHEPEQARISFHDGRIEIDADRHVVLLSGCLLAVDFLTDEECQVGLLGMACAALGLCQVQQCAYGVDAAAVEAA